MNSLTKLQKKAQEPVQAPVNESGNFIVAVTACTTGIAHTYMAQEALQKVAAEMGVWNKGRNQRC